MVEPSSFRITRPIPVLRLTVDVVPFARNAVYDAVVAADDGEGEGYRDERIALAARHRGESFVRYALTGSRFDLDLWALPIFDRPLFHPDDLLPRLVAQAALADANHPLTTRPREVGLELAVNDLRDLLGSPNRRLPVLLFTDPAPSFIDELSAAVTGLAHLIYVPPAATFALSDAYPRHRAFHGTVRLFRPGLTAEDPGHLHPRWFPQQISAQTPGSMLRTICTAQAPASPSLDLFELARAAAPITLVERSEAVAQLQSENQRQKLQIEALRADVALLNELLAEAERERASDRAAHVEPVPVKDSGLPPYSEADRLVPYLDRLYPERFLVLPRAVRSYADGAFRDRALLADALDVLGVDYFAEMHGLPGAKARFEARIRNLHLRVGGSLSRGGRFNSQYEARYRDVTYTLDRHLRNESNTRAPERCLGIYFTYDTDRRRIVLGSLPGHLDCRNS